jgi:hydroxymethylpyrimidine pyrophosphatase-like HAD family hydrolase
MAPAMFVIVIGFILSWSVFAVEMYRVDESKGKAKRRIRELEKESKLRRGHGGMEVMPKVVLKNSAMSDALKRQNSKPESKLRRGHGDNFDMMPKVVLKDSAVSDTLKRQNSKPESKLRRGHGGNVDMMPKVVLKDSAMSDALKRQNSKPSETLKKIEKPKGEVASPQNAAAK